MLSRRVLTQLGRLNRRRATQDLSQYRPQLTTTSEVTPLAGREVQNEAGAHWQIDTPLTELWPRHNRFLNPTSLAEMHSERDPDWHSEAAALADALPQRALFLDLETCGFAGAMVFLTGLLSVVDGQWRLTQLLARNYAEEKAMLQTLWRYAAKYQVLVTFNGKSFDWPTVHDRSTVHLLGFDARDIATTTQSTYPGVGPLQRDVARPTLTHCDLLHHARRRWKNELPNCRLQTLEQFLCGRRRQDDIPGRAIPDAYHEYVRSGDDWPLRSILHHNALDLVTSLQISLRLLCVRRVEAA